MVMKGFVVVVGTLLVLSLMSFSSFYFYEDDEFLNVMSGNAIRERVVDFYEASSVGDRFLILTWFIAGIATFSFIYFTIRGLRKKKGFSKDIFIKGQMRKSRTDLDTLYEILKQKRIIEIADIEKAFSVDSEIAFEWAKILENGNLAIIEYPRFKKPTLKLIEREVKKKNGVEETIVPVEEKVAEKKGIVVREKVVAAKEKVVEKSVAAKEKIIKKKLFTKKVAPKKKDVEKGVAQRIIAAQLAASEMENEGVKTAKKKTTKKKTKKKK